ncbi:helix-turn-helix domain-containing protein [Kribbella sp. NPDC002412]
MELVAEDLEAFAVFAQHRNFTRAAEELHVSQPALHTRIRKLEGRLGRPLYAKQGRILQLTEAGERLAAFRERHPRPGRRLPRHPGRRPAAAARPHRGIGQLPLSARRSHPPLPGEGPRTAAADR